MAKTEGVIRLNYSKARQQADRLEEVAAELRRISKSGLEESVNSLVMRWKGPSSELFARKELELAGEIIDNAREIEAIAEAIRAAAKKVYDADMRAAEIASRIGGGCGFGGSGGGYGGR